MKYLCWLVALILPAGLLAGCTDMIGSKSAAQSQIDTFHKLFNDEKYADIYAAADQKFKDSAPEKKLDDLLAAVHRKLGLVKSTTNENWNVSSFNFTTRIVMIQNTEFEHGSARESFTYIISGSDATLLGYNINSNDLIEK